MRVAFYLLLLANLLFLAWAEWIAVPAVPAEVPSGVPRLELVGQDVPASPPAEGAAQAPAGALSAALTAQAAAPAPSGADAAPASQCLSVGPFGRNRDASKAIAFLRARNLAPRQRAAVVQPVQWYWVYLPDVSDPARERRALAQLRHDGLAGAEAMPTPDGKPGISLGLFQDASLAQRQLARARAKGFAAKLSARLVAQPVYWLDVWVAGGAAALPLQALNADLGGTFATQDCPPGATPPLPNDATGAVTPGVPLPAEDSTAASPP